MQFVNFLKLFYSRFTSVVQYPRYLCQTWHGTWRILINVIVVLSAYLNLQEVSNKLGK